MGFKLTLKSIRKLITKSFQLQPNSAAGSGALEHDPCCLYRQINPVSISDLCDKLILLTSIY